MITTICWLLPSTTLERCGEVGGSVGPDCPTGSCCDITWPLSGILSSCHRSRFPCLNLQAIVRSASLGGNLYNNASGNTRSPPTSTAAASIERENLVRILATILRASSASSVHRIASERVGIRAPSSNVQDKSCTQETGVEISKESIKNTPVCEGVGGVEARPLEPPKRQEHTEGVVRYAVKAAEQQALAQALIEFLPPARSDGVHGITRYSVSLIPEWSAPPSLTANVCGCLLHLLGDSSAGENVANQVS